MEWRDRGLVLAVRRHGERDAILEAMTERHGRHLGLVRGGRSSRHAAVLQPGNTLDLVWRARLEEHLGHFVAEPVVSRAGRVVGDRMALHAAQHLAHLLRLLPERTPNAPAYFASEGLLDLFDHPALLAANFVRFEAFLLAELGFGLDLARCAATGEAEDLAYVSPKTGRAVSRQAGADWADRLLPLPAFLRESGREAPEWSAIADGFRLTGRFLDRHIYGPRRLEPSTARAALLAGFFPSE